MGNTFQWNDRELLRYLGCKNGTAPDQNTADLIMQCKQELEAVASPRVTWREYPLSFQGHVIDMTCLQTQSKSLERNLRDCERVLLFAATLGSQVDVLLHRYNMIQMSKAVVMQAASVAMLETFCDEQNEKLKEEYQEKGWYLRPRFSPGYGDFPLECQKQIAPARCEAWKKPCQPVCQRKNGSALRHSSLSGRCAPGRSRLAACKRFHSKLYGRYDFRSGRILF